MPQQLILCIKDHPFLKDLDPEEARETVLHFLEKNASQMINL